MNPLLKQVDTLMQQEMSRKEFLRIAGAGLLGIIGVTTLLQNLHKVTSPAGQAQSNHHSAISGYGSSPYGK